MESKVTMQATPSEFRLIREAVAEYAQVVQDDAQSMPYGAERARREEKAGELRELEARL